MSLALSTKTIYNLKEHFIEWHTNGSGTSTGTSAGVLVYFGKAEVHAIENVLHLTFTDYTKVERLPSSRIPSSYQGTGFLRHKIQNNVELPKKSLTSCVDTTKYRCSYRMREPK